MLCLDPLVEAAGLRLDAFPQSFLGQTRVQGKLMGLPMETDAYLLYYNRGLFDARDMAYPDVAWTPEQLIERAMALDAEELTAEDVKWMILLILLNQPGQESAFALMEELVYNGNPGFLH